jgi:hypothetical protein
VTIRRNIVKSCCGGNNSITIYMDRPICKHQVYVFKDAGFTVPEHYLNSGMFYVRKDTLVASASFGMTKVNVRCGAFRREEQLTEFENLLETAINIGQAENP